MSGDSVPLTLTLARSVANSCEATILYRELRKPLLRYLICLGLSTDEAEDVVQDAFLSLQQHLAAGGSQQNIRGWVFRVAHNLARNRQKSYHRRFIEPFDPGVEFVDAAATPEKAVLDKEKSRRLGRAIAALTESERECLLLRASGLLYREIGEALAMATSTVGATVDRAIKKLAENCNV